MKIMQCRDCGIDFDLYSVEKRRVGGLAITCADCSEEVVVKYAGVQAADGKQSQATILKFDSEQDKSRYIAFWQSTSGLHKGKSCQLSRTAMTDPGIKFKTVVGHNPTNHKGKS